jgi:hypothetical protein
MERTGKSVEGMVEKVYGGEYVTGGNLHGETDIRME